MRKNERMFLLVTAVIMIAVCGFLTLRMFYHNDENVSGPLLPVPENQLPPDEETPKPQEKEKVYVNVYFIGQNANKEEVYKAVAYFSNKITGLIKILTEQKLNLQLIV